MPGAHGAQEQPHYWRPLNECWPASPQAIPPAPEPVRVRARVVWPDGERWVIARADRWRGRFVHVVFRDAWRSAAIDGAWLDAVDVERA